MEKKKESILAPDVYRALKKAIRCYGAGGVLALHGLGTWTGGCTLLNNVSLEDVKEAIEHKNVRHVLEEVVYDELTHHFLKDLVIIISVSPKNMLPTNHDLLVYRYVIEPYLAHTEYDTFIKLLKDNDLVGAQYGFEFVGASHYILNSFAIKELLTHYRTLEEYREVCDSGLVSFSDITY